MFMNTINYSTQTNSFNTENITHQHVNRNMFEYCITETTALILKITC